MKKLTIDIIGSGNISKYHIEALIKSNFELGAIAGSFRSASARKLAKKYKFKKYYELAEDLAVNCSKDANALLICCNVENSIKYIQLAGTKIKILCEKPVSTNLDLLKIVKRKYPNVRVAYNRRFYESVQFLKKKIKKENTYIANIELPEKILNSKYKFKKVFENSVHVFDLLNYLFDNPKINYVKNSNKNFFKNFSFISNNNNLINLTCNWNSPSNFKIEVFFHNEKYILNPIEILSIYKGMKIAEPTDSCPVRIYTPNKIFETKIKKEHTKYKPGFKAQSENFYKFIIGKSNIMPNLNDAYNAMLIAKKVVQ